MNFEKGLHFKIKNCQVNFEVSRNLIDMFDEELSKNAIYTLSSTSMPIELTDLSAISALVKENCTELKFTLEHSLLNNDYKDFKRKSVPIIDDKDIIGGSSKFIAAVEKRDVPHVVTASSSSNPDHVNTVSIINDLSNMPPSIVAVQNEGIAAYKSNVISSSIKDVTHHNHTSIQAEVNERKILNMMEVTKAKREDAIFYLGMYNWDLDSAISEYLNNENH